MAGGPKRKAEGEHFDGRDKRAKKQWKVPRKSDNNAPHPTRTIQPGDSGIWATCNKGKEGKCLGELRDLFSEYAEILYPDSDDSTSGNGRSAPNTTNDDNDDDDDDDDAEIDIEASIRGEVASIRRPTKPQLFTPIKVDMPCVVFFKTIAPVDPVALVKRICEDAMDQAAVKRTRFVKRLSPMTLMGRASEEALGKVATEVLAPHFHREPREGRRFAIRPTIRNHNVLKRDGIIKQVASLVGPGHTVDLKAYDTLIVVEVYKNICGVSVLDGDFERLKRYNLTEIYDPTPKTEDVPETETVPEISEDQPQPADDEMIET